MITIVNYGMGNLRSVEKAFTYLGHDARVSDNPSDLEDAEGIVLPGVGSFGDAMYELRDRGFVEPLLRMYSLGAPFLGICLGYQLIFEYSEESPGVEGLGMLKGKVTRFSHELKIPHMGWNDARIRVNHPVLEGVEDGSFFYFVHSYYVVPSSEECILCETDYGLDFVSGVAARNMVAFQFHPEKSGTVGLRILDNFAGMCRGRG